MKPHVSTEPMISDLYFYPIKSFRGFRVNELRFDSRGAMYDRQWMLIDEKGGFLTQRQLPQLAKIGVQFDGETGLELTAAGTEPIDFGLNEHEETEIMVKVWKDTVPAYEVSGEVSDWLSGVIDKKVRLVRISDKAERAFSEKIPGRFSRFHDAPPVLVIGKESLRDLERKANATFAVSRFRPNVVIENIPVHAEDTWGGFSVDGVKFSSVKPCSRCKITTLHPLTGEAGEEPLKTLSTYRKAEDGKINFGQYYAHLNEGRLKVGSKVTQI